MNKNYFFNVKLGKYSRFDTYRDKLASELERRGLVLSSLELDKILERLANCEDGYNDCYLSGSKTTFGLSVYLRM